MTFAEIKDWLSENDYTVKWENNKEIGKASATVSVNSQNGNFYILKPIKVSFIALSSFLYFSISYHRLCSNANGMLL